MKQEDLTLKLDEKLNVMDRRVYKVNLKCIGGT